MERTERRINKRVPARFKINFIHEGDYLISYTKDISVNGMFIYTQSPPSVGEVTILTFSPNGSEEFTVNARVIWVNKNRDKKDHGVGVQFIDSPIKLRRAMLEFVKRIAIIGKELIK